MWDKIKIALVAVPTLIASLFAIFFKRKAKKQEKTISNLETKVQTEQANNKVQDTVASTTAKLQSVADKHVTVPAPSPTSTDVQEAIASFNKGE